MSMLESFIIIQGFIHSVERSSIQCHGNYDGSTATKLTIISHQKISAKMADRNNRRKDAPQNNFFGASIRTGTMKKYTAQECVRFLFGDSTSAPISVRVLVNHCIRLLSRSGDLADHSL